MPADRGRPCICASGGLKKTLFYTTLLHHTLGDILDNTMAGTRIRRPTEKMQLLMQEQGRALDGSDGSEGSKREMTGTKKARMVGGAQKMHVHEKPKGGAREKPKVKTKGKEKLKDSGGAPEKQKKGGSRARSDENVIDLVGDNDDEENGEGDEESGADGDEDGAAGVRHHVECQCAAQSNPASTYQIPLV